jgi:hypothetical protein
LVVNIDLQFYELNDQSYNVVAHNCTYPISYTPTKPTTEEIQAHLVAIAEKKYPIGTKFKDGNDKQFEISETEFDYDNRENALYGRCYEFSGWVRIWDNGKWAEIVAPIETEQRWIVEVQPFADHRDDVKIVVTLNDGFISKSSGRQLAEAIKKYLNIE